MPRVDRWDVRVESRKDRLVRRAAEVADKTFSDFVRDAAVIEAERILADRTQFELPPERWARFIEILDRAPQQSPRLRKLFSRRSVLAEQ